MTKNTFQILITDTDEELPPILKDASNTFKEAFTDTNYNLYTKGMIQDIISQKLGKEVLLAFNKLKPYAYKADLARYCIGYLFGGWYADISIRFIAKSIQIKYNFEFLGFIDKGKGHGLPNQLYYPINNSFFYVDKGNHIMAKAIDLILENCSKESYGVSAVCPTGPGVLGRAISFFGQNKNHVLGYLAPLTPNHQKLNISYILPDGTIIAQYKDTWFPQAKPGSISCFGLKGSNNYHKMYLDKDIYNI